MKRSTSILLFCVFSYAFMLFVLPSRAVAAVPPSLLVSPYEEITTVGKGSATTFQFTVRNNSSTTARLQISFVDFKAPDNKSGTPLYFTPTVPDPSYYPDAWFSTPLPVLNIKPNSSINVPISATIPANASPGGHYGGIEFESITQGLQGGTGISIASKIAVPVIFTISGQLREQVGLDSFSLSPSVFNYFSGINGSPSCASNGCKVQASAQFKNTGNVHEAPVGSIKVTNIFGQTVYTTGFNTTKGFVLPGSQRDYSVSIPTDKFTGLNLGHYTVTLSITYGQHATTLTSTVGLWLINYTDLIVLVILILIIVSTYVFNRYNKGKIRNRYI